MIVKQIIERKWAEMWTEHEDINKKAVEHKFCTVQKVTFKMTFSQKFCIAPKSRFSLHWPIYWLYARSVVSHKYFVSYSSTRMLDVGIAFYLGLYG